MLPAAAGGAVAAALGYAALVVRRRRRRARNFKQFEDDNAPLPFTMPGIVPGLRTGGGGTDPSRALAAGAIVESPLQMEMAGSQMHRTPAAVEVATGTAEAGGGGTGSGERI